MRPMGSDAAIGAALGRSVERVRQTGPGRWSFELVNGRRLPGLALRQEDWLELRVPLPDRIGSGAGWEVLRLNGHLPGVARMVRYDERRVGLQGDVAIGSPELASRRIAVACDALRSAEALRTGKRPARRAEKSESEEPGHGEPSWERWGEETGWRITRREDGRHAVELDAPGLMNQAFLERRGSAPVLSLELVRSAGLAEPGRRAIAVFLLGVTGRLRMVRAALTRNDPEAVRLEVALPEPDPTGAELDWGLEALSLACRLASREVRALGQEPLAGIYLAHTTEE